VSSNPYHGSKSSKPSTRPSAFVFLDILGYKEMILQAKGVRAQTRLLRNLHSALERGQAILDPENEYLRPDDKDSYVLRAFTDNIVIGWPVHDDAELELGILYGRLAEFQFDMTISGFFVRGAVSLGNAFVDDITVFGPALLDAYNGESKLARDPRIILMPSATEAMVGHVGYYSDPGHSPQNSQLLVDADDQPYINYLETVLIAVDECGPFYDELSAHKHQVELRLEQFKANPAVWSKYAWVARYHNYFCSQYPSLFNETHRIEPGLFSAEPRRLTD